MNVVRLPIELEEFALPLLAKLGEDGSQARKDSRVDTLAPVFRDENFVQMEAENTVV